MMTSFARNAVPIYDDRSIVLKNVPIGMITEQQFQADFARDPSVPGVWACNYNRAKNSNQRHGIAFVNFFTAEQAQNGLRTWHNRSYHGVLLHAHRRTLNPGQVASSPPQIFHDSWQPQNDQFEPPQAQPAPPAVSLFVLPPRNGPLPIVQPNGQTLQPSVGSLAEPAGQSQQEPKWNPSPFLTQYVASQMAKIPERVISPESQPKAGASFIETNSLGLGVPKLSPPKQVRAVNTTSVQKTQDVPPESSMMCRSLSKVSRIQQYEILPGVRNAPLGAMRAFQTARSTTTPSQEPKFQVSGLNLVASTESAEQRVSHEADFKDKGRALFASADTALKTVLSSSAGRPDARTLAKVRAPLEQNKRHFADMFDFTPTKYKARNAAHSSYNINDRRTYLLPGRQDPFSGFVAQNPLVPRNGIHHAVMGLTPSPHWFDGTLTD